MIKSYENNFFPGSELTLLYKRAIKHTDKMHSTKCWYLTHTIRNAFSFTSRPSGGFASNRTFKVCGEDSNLSWSGSSWVGGRDSLALNGPFDGAKHLPSLGALFSLTLAPWGNAAKRKADRSAPALGVALSHWDSPDWLWHSQSTQWLVSHSHRWPLPF